MTGRTIVGTSSWADPGFIEKWDPADLPAAQRLPWYAERFEAVEVNSTWYALPSVRSVARWADQTPDGFSFDIKLHRLLSRHAGKVDSLPDKLRGEAEFASRGRVRLTPRLERALLDQTLEGIAPLVEAGKLGAFLLQLSPSFEPRKHVLSELDALVDHLAPHPVAIEFRHRAWVRGEQLERTLGHLEAIGAVFVCVDAPRGRQITLLPPIDAVTNGRLAYLRAHGRNAEGWARGKSVAERFGWVYSDGELEEIHARVERLAEAVPTVRLMFNNNKGADAPHAAERFRELVGQAQPA
ncbi:MAG TPA: DUF72 domain-containing protein [Solirubrobacteraceae bacterium]